MKPVTHYAVRLAGALEPLCLRRRGAITFTQDARLVTCRGCRRALVSAWGEELA